MSISLRGSGTLAAMVLAMLASSADAQRAATPTRPGVMPPGGAPGYSAPNIGGLGSASQQLPPNMYGYASMAPGGAVGPAAAGAPGSDPYAISGAPSYNPYMGGATIASNPYGPPQGGYSGSSIPPVLPYGPTGYGEGMIGAGPGVGYGSAMQGLASYTQAAGRYWIDIQQARMSREQVYQTQIETARRRIEFERWYESVRPTAAKMIESERASEIDYARKGASDNEVTSGKALNSLLGSIKKYGKYNTGPNIPIEDNILKQINMAGGAAGNIGMLKNNADLTWPEALLESGYDDARKTLMGNLRKAVGAAKDGDAISASLLKDIRASYTSINTRLNEGGQDDVSAQQYMEARRFLNQLNSAITALRDPNVSKYFGAWNAKGKTVAELVDHMTREGLTFAPAAPGEEAAYRALYPALRSFEAGLQVAAR